MTNNQSTGINLNISGSTVVITGNTVDTNLGTGLYLGLNGVSATITNNTVTNNTASQSAGVWLQASGGSLDFGPTSSPPIPPPPPPPTPCT